MFVFISYAQNNPTITINPNSITNDNTKINSHLIGAVRNHVVLAEGYHDPMLSAKIEKYGEISPRFGDKKKIYRLGGNHIDGFLDAVEDPPGSEMYHWEIKYLGFDMDLFDEYDNSPYNGDYPYDNLQHYFDEVIALNADMCVQINVGTDGTAAKAKALVQKIKDKGYLDNVAFFELGAEISGSWIRGHNEKALDANNYCQTIAPFITAMREVDPNIKIALMGSYNYRFGWDGDWTMGTGFPAIQFEEVISTYLNYQNNGNYLDFDFIAMHGYPPVHIFGNFENGDCGTSTLTEEQMIPNLLGVNSWAEETLLKDINDLLINDSEAREIKLVNTEYGSMVNNYEFPNIVQSMTEALYTGDEIITSINNNVQAAINYSLLHTIGTTENEHTDNLFFKSNFINGSTELVVTPIFKTHKLIAENLGQDKITSSGQNIPTHTITKCNRHNPSQNPNESWNITYDQLRFVSTKDPDGTIRTLVINNGDSAQPIDFVIQEEGDYCIRQKTVRGTAYFSKFGDIIEENEILPSLTGNTIEPFSVNMFIMTPENGTCTDLTIQNPPSNSETIWDINDPLNLPPSENLGTVIVKSGSILTIKDETIIKFCQDGILIIEEGARVNLLGATLTSCDTWQGVDVKGGPGHQDLETDDPITTLAYQGIFYSTGGTNDARIENATIGIRAFFLYNNFPVGGGIVQCTNTTFYNNYIGTYFGYHELFYNAFFNGCTFTSNFFYAHCLTYLNRGISFTDSDFNSTIVDGDIYYGYHSHGILSYSASINVNNCKFKKLYTGVHVSQFLRPTIFSVLSSTFDECLIGVNNLSVSSPTIWKNNFNLGDMPVQYEGLISTGSKAQIGVIYQGLISGLGIQENNFINTVGTTSDLDMTGLYIHDIGDSPNIVVDNYFQGLTSGNRAVEFNASYSNGGFNGDNGQTPPIDQGLLYICNKNEVDIPNTLNDFNVTGPNDPTNQSREGMAYNQGIFKKAGQFEPADNIFSILNVDDHDFICFQNSTPRYHYKDYPPRGTNGGIKYYNGIEPIPTNLDNRICGKGSFKVDFPTEEYNTSQAAYNTALNEYNQAILSDDAVQLELITNELLFQKQKMNFAAMEGYKIAISNPDDYSQQDVRDWMERLNTIAGDMMLMQDYVRTNELVVAQDILDQIPVKYHLDGDALFDFQNIEYIWQAIMTNTAFNLPADVIANMTLWADSKEGQACYLSRDILTMLGTYYPPVFNPVLSNVPQNRKQTFEQNRLINSAKFVISPNPATENINFSVQNKNWEGITTISIHDLMGKEIEVFYIGENQSDINISVNIPNGLYICQVKSKNKTEMTTKLVINH